MKEQIHLLNNFGMSVVLTISITTGCGQSGSLPDKAVVHDPIELASPIKGVCKIGERGGDGTLISKQWILTAAHVALGMYDRSGGELTLFFEDGTTRKAEFIYSHPDFESGVPADIALIYFSEPVEQIQPVQLYRKTDESGKEIMLAGHGDKHNEDDTWIRDGKLRAYTNVVDSTNHELLMFDYDTPGKNCKISEGTSGPGDSGGPALINNNGQLQIAGISSMGDPGKHGAATIGAREFFTRVSTYADWIDQVMKDPQNSNSQKINVLEKEHLVSEPAVIPDAAKQIIDALANYSSDNMKKAISNGYDSAVLKKRTPDQIMDNMPFLIAELQQSTLVGVISQSKQKLTVQMKKGNNLYLLEFFLLDNQKIEQLAFGKMD